MFIHALSGDKNSMTPRQHERRREQAPITLSRIAVVLQGCVSGVTLFGMIFMAVVTYGRSDAATTSSITAITERMGRFESAQNAMAQIREADHDKLTKVQSDVEWLCRWAGKPAGSSAGVRP